ncbi:hypothetical protein HXX76_001516 [Chlamydomonas incerta]|uniref:Protein kinase domain-containing protein n=1 Tax=Chlamydomonas incerta TaxID=51695 RepID=A0A836B1Q4_CHLIN|nr:hypothetical protein HXX76_001516 [Chlamydomonas incerta]|eukprot:KAG2444773.1 hypothetical protein HXX76_001516 [Chlamydomonas incerta]
MCARLYGLVETASGVTGMDWDLVLIAVGAHAAAASAAALAAVAGAPGHGPPGRSSGSTIASATAVAVEEGVRMELLSQAYNVRAPATRVIYPHDAYAPSPLAPAGATPASGVRCMAAVPMMQGDRMVGALLLEERQAGSITTEPSDAATSISVLGTGFGASAAHAPASGPRALGALGNSTSSVVMVASGAGMARASGRDATAGLVPPSPAAALLRDTEMLRALSFTASMCLIGSGSDKLLWLAQSVIRLRSAGSLQTLVGELVEAVVAHVKRRFILDAYAGVAMVPPAAPLPSSLSTSAPIGDAIAQATAPSPQPQAEVKALVGLLLRLQAGAGSGATCDTIGSCSADDVVEGGGESTGGGNSVRSASRRRRSLLLQTGRGSAPTTPTAAAAAAATNAVAAAAAAAAPAPGAGVGPGMSGGAAANSNGNSPWRNGPPAEADAAGASVRSISRFFASLAGGVMGGGVILNTAGSAHTPRPHSGAHYTGFGSFAGRNLSAASVVIPLSAADMATVNAAAAGAGGTPAALHANAFPMQNTLLAAVLALRQQEAAALRERERLLSAPSTPFAGGGGADAAAPAAALLAATPTAAAHVAATAAAAAATAAVVDDTQLYVQGVHNPSRDVVLLCSVLAQAHAAGPHQPAPAAATPPAGGAAAAAQTRVSTANGMAPTAITSPAVGPASNNASGAASGAAATVTSGNFSAAATAALGSAAPGPPAPPQSLVLLTLSLDRTGAGEPGGLLPLVPSGPGGSADAGAALGMYVCFARRLPAALLEAVRESCQELLDQALACPFRERLRGPLAPEYELLKQAQVGSYAVLRGTGVGGPAAADDASLGAGASGPGGGVRAGTALLESLLGRSRRLAAAVAGGGAAGAVLSPNSTLSSYLSTADLEAVQGQDRAHTDAAIRGSCSMRRSSLSADPRQGGATGTGRAAGGSATTAGQRALHATPEVTGRSTSIVSTRSVTVGGLAPVAGAGTAVSGSMARSAMPAGGDGRALGTGGGGLTMATAPVADDLLDLLMGSCTGDIHATADGITPAGPGRSASIIHVTGVETGGATAQKQMDLLVTSIQATINASAVGNGATAGAFASDLEQLELQEVLGRGGGGVVLKGLLNGTLQVAVKVMEMPDVEGEADAAAAAAAAPPGPDGAPAPAIAPNPAKQLRARRELLRNAMELAVQGSASHPNIVQFYSTFNNVVLRSRAAPDGQAGGVTDPRSLYLEPAPPVPEKGDNEARVTCILAEYCDAGSLGAALQSRAFPRLARTPVRTAAYGSTTATFIYDMKGVYMVLLDVALALRHLHSMHLVHRDIKPANLLLKSNPSDYRGFSVKLADFGFVLHLNETGEDGSRFANVDQACGTVTHMAPECMPGKAKIDASADIYSFGILCWELLAGGVRPFPHVHPDKIPRMVYKGARPTFSDNVPVVYRNLAQQCWCTTPSRRPKANELVSIITQQLQAL